MKIRCLLVLSIFAVSYVEGQNSSKLEALNSELVTEQTKLEGIRGQKIGKLFDGYSKALVRAADAYQKAGDLESTLKVRAEIERMKTDRTVGKDDFPGADKMRPVLEGEMEKIEKTYQADLSQLNSLFAQKLETLKIELTKEGKIEEAIAVAEKIKAIESTMTAKPSEGTPAAAVAPSGPSTEIQIELIEDRVVDTALSGNKVLHGTIRLEPGRHSLRKQVIIGDDKLDNNDPEQNGSITVPPGCQIEKEEIYINQGELSATRSLFSNIELAADLGGKYMITDCLIDDVVFKKSGGWFSSYSAKFEIKNCVLRKSYFTKCNKSNMGINITNSTFLDVKFEEIEFKDDAGMERRDDWRNIENCRFINCDIPQSVLLITKNCVFENCKFGRQERLPGKTLSDVTLFYEGLKPAPPAGTANVEFKIDEAKNLSTPVGSTIAYKIENDSLQPR